MGRWKDGQRKRVGKQRTPQNKTRKLNLRKEEYFKYDLNNIFERSDIEEGQKNSITASLLVISSIKGIHEAKEYLKGKMEEGILTEDIYNKISLLLERYSFRRV